MSKEEIAIIYEYPKCPYFCEVCKILYGEIICLKCKPDRVKVGMVCKCKDKSAYEDKDGNC